MRAGTAISRSRLPASAAGNGQDSRARALAAGEIADLAGCGPGQQVAAQGRLLLAAARPEWPGHVLDEVAIGDRDAAAARLHRRPVELVKAASGAIVTSAPRRRRVGERPETTAMPQHAASVCAEE